MRPGAATKADNWQTNTFLPFHPGAVRYYEEKGIDIPDRICAADAHQAGAAIRAPAGRRRSGGNAMSATATTPGGPATPSGGLAAGADREIVTANERVFAGARHLAFAVLCVALHRVPHRGDEPLPAGDLDLSADPRHRRADPRIPAVLLPDVHGRRPADRGAQRGAARAAGGRRGAAGPRVREAGAGDRDRRPRADRGGAGQDGRDIRLAADRRDRPRRRDWLGLSRIEGAASSIRRTCCSRSPR